MALALPDWSIDHVVIVDGRVEIEGWILPPRNAADIEVLVNGEPAELQLREARLDVKDAWIALEQVEPLSFTAFAPVPAGVIEFELRCDGVIRPLNGWSQAQDERFSVPEGTRRERVHGTAAEQNFLRTGHSNYRRIKALIARFAPRKRRPIRILDWGCGAGSVGRYAIVDPQLDYTGADIDIDNIAWCRQHIDPDRFIAIDTEPPTPLKKSSFDVVFGISVLTHLNEQNQFKWLAELRRITRPGGICLLSILGVQAQAKIPWLLTDAYALGAYGFQFIEEVHEIGQIVGQDTYYGIAYHLKPYVRREWSRWFDVIDFVPGALGHQDVVVLRRRRFPKWMRVKRWPKLALDAISSRGGPVRTPEQSARDQA